MKRPVLNSIFPSVLIAILLVLVSAPAYADADSDRYDASGACRKAMSIGHTKVPAELADFPDLTSLSSDIDLANDVEGDQGDQGDEDDQGDQGDQGDEDDQGDKGDKDQGDEGAQDDGGDKDQGDEGAQDDGGIPYVTISGGGGAYPTSPTISTISINMPGKLTTTRVSSSGKLLESFIVTDNDGKLVLQFDRGSSIVCANNKAPQRMVLELVDSLPPPSGAVIIGPIYELSVYTTTHSSTPSPVIISPPATMVLAYDPDGLPENTSSVFVAYYDEEQGWMQLEFPNGLVAEVGKATAQVSHFTPFAVIAELAPCPPPAEGRNLDINANEVSSGGSATISAPLATVALVPTPPTPPVEASGYTWLMLTAVIYVVIYAVVAAFAVTARGRLQRKRLRRVLNL